LSRNLSIEPNSRRFPTPLHRILCLDNALQEHGISPVGHHHRVLQRHFADIAAALGGSVTPRVDDEDLLHEMAATAKK
jgi:hypothetical protein